MDSEKEREKLFSHYKEAIQALMETGGEAMAWGREFFVSRIGISDEMLNDMQSKLQPFVYEGAYENIDKLVSYLKFLGCTDLATFIREKSSGQFAEAAAKQERQEASKGSNLLNVLEKGETTNEFNLFTNFDATLEVLRKMEGDKWASEQVRGNTNDTLWAAIDRVKSSSRSAAFFGAAGINRYILSPDGRVFINQARHNLTDNNLKKAKELGIPTTGIR